MAATTEPTTTTALALPTESMGEMIDHRTCLELVKIYQESVAAIERCMEEIVQRGKDLDQAFAAGTQASSSFEIDFHFRGQTYYHGHSWPDLFKRIRKTAWATLIDHLGVKKIMSVKKREEFDRQLESGDLPEITEEAVMGILGGLVHQAQDFAREAAIEVFNILRPDKLWGKGYKTNDAFRVGKRVILTWMVERKYSSTGFNVSYRHDAKLNAIDGVFHLMDGKGVIKGHRSPLVQAIIDSEAGIGETEYFKFRCFKNRNLHLEFKRLDLVKQLNLLAAGEAVLGHDPD